jgi:hypothetical protein
MRRTRRLGLLAAVLLGLCGCTTTDQQITPPKMPEEFRSPPPEDRYTGPPKFPRDTLNQGLIRRQDDTGTPAPGGPGSPGNPRGGSGSLRGPAPGPSYN